MPDVPLLFGREAQCYGCGHPLNMPELQARGDLFTCSRCGIVTVAVGILQQATTAARVHLYRKYDGDADFKYPGLFREARTRHAIELGELNALLAAKEVDDDLYATLRAGMLAKHTRELMDIRNEKSRGMYRVKKEERRIRERLIAEGKMVDPATITYQHIRRDDK